MNKIPLFATYTIAQVEPATWEAFFGLHHAHVFTHEPEAASLELLLSDTEKAQLAALRHNLNGALQWHFLLYDGEQPVGWHFGFQRNDLDYFMANTGILPAYQNQGLYTAFLKFIISRAAEAGFQYLTSVHHSDNNAVLVPKLKAGFVLQAFGYLIQTMLLEANVGPMVQLVYPVKAEYRPWLGFRAGLPNARQLG